MERKRRDTLVEPSLPGVLFHRKLVMVTVTPLQNGVTLRLSNAFPWGFDPVPGDSLRFQEFCKSNNDNSKSLHYSCNHGTYC